MISDTLKLWGKGAITLPKKWREKYPTKHFIAKESPDGSLVIKPILDDVIYYEEDNHVGLRFPYGVDPQRIIDAIDEIDSNKNG